MNENVSSSCNHENDYISRRAAIDAVVGCTNCGTEDELRAYVTKHSLDNGWTGGIVDALDAIEQLPSAQPERKTGTWIAVDYFADGKPAYREWECSACGCVVEDEKPTGNFCKMCGADMRGKQDDKQASTNND